MKAYNSIPHLSMSRLGSGDRHIAGQQEHLLCVATRPGDRVIVTEKVDGCCATIARKDGELIALSRGGFLADGGGIHLDMFAIWFGENRTKFELLNEGERICGEWLAVAHGTLYDNTHEGFEPWLGFDMFRGNARVTRDQFIRLTSEAALATTKVLHDGTDACSPEKAMEALGEFGHHGALEEAEGAVWRLERDGKVPWVAKCIRQSHAGAKHFKRGDLKFNWGADRWHVVNLGDDERGYPIFRLEERDQ
jgi:hypothetical protein